MPRQNRPRSIESESHLAARIAYERERRGLSYEGLAQLMTDAGCSVQGSAVYRIEKGDPPRRISVNELVALSSVLGVPVDDLLEPLEVIEQRRAKELLHEMAATDTRLFDSLAEWLSVYSEFLTLASSNPELHQFVTGHRFSSSYMPDPESDPGGDDGELFHIEGVPAGTTAAFTPTFAEFYGALINLAGDIASALGNTKEH